MYIPARVSNVCRAPAPRSFSIGTRTLEEKGSGYGRRCTLRNNKRVRTRVWAHLGQFVEFIILDFLGEIPWCRHTNSYSMFIQIRDSQELIIILIYYSEIKMKYKETQIYPNTLLTWLLHFFTQHCSNKIALNYWEGILIEHFDFKWNFLIFLSSKISTRILLLLPRTVYMDVL